MGRRVAVLGLVTAALVFPGSALGATGQLQNGTMIYTADAGESNNVVFAANPSDFGSPTFEVRDAASVAIAATPPCFTGGQQNIMECPQDGGGTGQVTQFQASLGDGDDTISIQANLPSALAGGGGNDTMSGGPANDTVNGQSGNDTETGGAGNDQLQGGTGDDRLLADDGADVLSGGDGTDTADYSARTAPQFLSLDGVQNDGQDSRSDNVEPDVENLIGGSAGDQLVGSDVANALVGGAGDDAEDGGAGADTLSGGDGNDTENGGADADHLSGDAGDDAEDGGAGPDTLSGGDGNDVEMGGPDDDSLAGDAGNDDLDGGTGADVIGGGDGIDTGDYRTRTAGVTVTLDDQPGDGEPGEDDNVETDVENLAGGSGADSFDGSAAANTLDGGAGEDYSDGGPGSDTLIGGDAGDVLRTRGSADPDTISCGPGPDFVIAKPSDTIAADCDRADRGVNQKPKLRDSAVVTPTGGSLQMSPAGIVRRVPLQDKVVLPLRSIVDTLAGAVKVTSAASKRTTQSISLEDGAFDITQTTAKLPLTQFALQGGDFSVCPAAARAGTARAAKNATTVRTLWASGKGKFRTKGRYAAAAIRGTRWQTVDRCDGTLIRVARGEVAVQDLVKKKTVLVTAGRTYLAKAR